MEAKKFGQFIAGIRKEKKMTQVELAEKIHVTDKAISRWERGLGFPDIQTLEPLAQVLGISVLELMRSLPGRGWKRPYRRRRPVGSGHRS